MTETLLTLAGKRVIGVANKYVQRTPDRAISLVWGIASMLYYCQFYKYASRH
jgi:hypothetical protein